MKQRGLVPNFHIHLSVSDLYISTIGPPILLQQCRNWERGRAVSLLGIIISNFLYSAFAVLLKLAAASVHLRILPILTQLMTTYLVVSFSYSPSEVRKDRNNGPLVVRLESLFVQWGGHISWYPWRNSPHNSLFIPVTTGCAAVHCSDDTSKCTGLYRKPRKSRV